MAPADEQDGARQARDVMAFGQEVGRVLSDGRVVGRAEPFAKVFPSSRVVKRAVGLAAWAVLEDIALDARLDEAGRLVADTNVRRIAANLGLNKDTVTRHLRTLREHGFVLQEEGRSDASGRWEPVRYVLDPSACLERFTQTPPALGPEPCPGSSDTVTPESVSEGAGHGRTGHGEPGQVCRDVDVDAEDQQQQKPSERARLAARLVASGVAPAVAADLVGRHPPDRVGEVLEVAAARRLRKPAGWIVAALRDGWDVSGTAAEARAVRARRRAEARAVEEARQRREADARHRRLEQAWAAVVSGALVDRRLVEAVERVTAPVPGLGRRPLPLVRGQLVAWAVDTARRHPRLPLREALAAALDAGAAPVEPAGDGELPDPPDGPAGPDLTVRLRAVLAGDRSRPVSERSL